MDLVPEAGHKRALFAITHGGRLISHPRKVHKKATSSNMMANPKLVFLRPFLARAARFTGTQSSRRLLNYPQSLSRSAFFFPSRLGAVAGAAAVGLVAICAAPQPGAPGSNEDHPGEDQGTSNQLPVFNIMGYVMNLSQCHVIASSHMAV